MEDMLNEDDHHDDVVHYLQSLTNEDLVALGSALGVSGSRMANVNELTDNVATAWLQMMDDVMINFGEPTWSALATALDEIGQSTVAARIRANGGKEGATGQLQGRIADIHSDHDTAANSQLSAATRIVPKDSRIENDDDEFSWDRYGDCSDTLFERKPAMDRGEYKAKLKLRDDDNYITEISPTNDGPLPFSRRGFYSMKSKRHGVALIVNNKTFEKHEFRAGTDRDEENLVETWKFLGYYVIVFRDRTRADMARIFLEIDSILKAVKDTDTNIANDSFVCCILSHGKEGEVYGSDSQPLEYTKIQRFLARSSILASRPKMLFIQACQGVKTFLGVVDHLKEIDADDEKISVYTDFYLSVASVDGVKSFRDAKSGTWFVSELCQTLCESSMVMDLDDLQKELNKRVVEEHEFIGYKQQPRGIDQLRKKVFFFHQ